jgi:hypothetical protein
VNFEESRANTGQGVGTTGRIVDCASLDQFNVERQVTIDETPHAGTGDYNGGATFA